MILSEPLAYVILSNPNGIFQNLIFFICRLLATRVFLDVILDLSSISTFHQAKPNQTGIALQSLQATFLGEGSSKIFEISDFHSGFQARVGV